MDVLQQGYNPATTGYGTQSYLPQFGQLGQQNQWGHQGQFGQQNPFGQLGQQGWLGGASTSFGGLIGSGIPGLLGQNIARQTGQVIDGFSQPQLDPVTAAYVQQTQLAQLAQQAQIAQLVQQAQLAQQLAQQRLQQAQFSPLAGIHQRIDPVTAAYIQQAQIAQLCQQLAMQNQLGQQNLFGQGQLGHGQFGQSQFGLPQFAQQGLTGGQNLWANPQLLAQLGRGLPFAQSQMGMAGYGGQIPLY